MIYDISNMKNNTKLELLNQAEKISRQKEAILAEAIEILSAALNKGNSLGLFSQQESDKVTKLQQKYITLRTEYADLINRFNILSL